MLGDVYVDGQEIDGSHLKIHHLLVTILSCLLLWSLRGILDQLLSQSSRLFVVGTCAKLLLFLFIIHEKEVAYPVIRNHYIHLF